jgi:hypothetical protein
LLAVAAELVLDSHLTPEKVDILDPQRQQFSES